MSVTHKIELNRGLATPVGKAVSKSTPSVQIAVSEPAMTSWRNLFMPSEKYVPKAIRSIKAKEDFYILAYKVEIETTDLEYDHLDIDLKMKFIRPEKARVLDHFPNRHTIDQSIKTRHATLWDSGFFNKDFPGILTSNLYEDSVSIHPAMTLHLTDVPGLTGLISIEQHFKTIEIEKHGRGWMWKMSPGDQTTLRKSQVILQTLAVPKNTKKSILSTQPTVNVQITGKNEIISKLGEEQDLDFSLTSHREFTSDGILGAI